MEFKGISQRGRAKDEMPHEMVNSRNGGNKVEDKTETKRRERGKVRRDKPEGIEK